MVNLAKWARNYIAVIDHLGGAPGGSDRYRSLYRDTVIMSNRFLAEALNGLLDYYDSGDYLSDGEKRKEDIAIESARRHQLYAGTFKEMLDNLKDESWR